MSWSIEKALNTYLNLWLLSGLPLVNRVKSPVWAQWLTASQGSLSLSHALPSLHMKILIKPHSEGFAVLQELLPNQCLWLISSELLSLRPGTGLAARCWFRGTVIYKEIVNVPGEEAAPITSCPRLFLLDIWTLFCKVIWSIDFPVFPQSKKSIRHKTTNVFHFTHVGQYWCFI